MNTYKFISPILLVFLLFSILLSHYFPIAESQDLTIKVNWRIHSNPTDSNDIANAVCEAGDYIYVVGEQDQSVARSDARIEMRFKSNGSLVKAWTSKGFSKLFDCVVTNNKLYVIGYPWDLLVFDLNLRLLSFERKFISYENVFIASSIQAYDNHVYIGGTKITKANNFLWRIEKWRIENLTLVKGYTSEPSLGNGTVATIEVNPVTKQLWAGGVYYKEGKGLSFKVEILDLDLNPIKVIKKDDVGDAYAISFDEEGNAYIGGYKFIAKYDKNGNEIKIKKVPYYVAKISYIKGYLFIGATEDIQNLFRHVLYVYDKNLNQIEKIVLSLDINEDSELYPGKMIFDGKNLYIAGYSYSGFDTEWVIYSISISKSSLTTNPNTTTSLPTISPEEFNIMYLIIGIAIATAIVSILIILIRRKLFKLPPIS
ncbi:MAG: hypothetical protein RQ968_03810 [Thermoproteota archaeon]|jgi:hypothetical protein|nr:hypothetical protein [Thermoproteota archaeon]